MDCTDNYELIFALLVVVWSVVSSLIKAAKKAQRSSYQPPPEHAAPGPPAPRRERRSTPTRSQKPAPVALDSFLENVFEELGIPVEKTEPAKSSESGEAREPWGPHDELWHEQEEGDPRLEHHGDRWGEHDTRDPRLEHHGDRWGEHDTRDPQLEHHGDRWGEHDTRDPQLEHHGDRWGEHDTRDPQLEHHGDRWGERRPGHEPDANWQQWHGKTPPVPRRVKMPRKTDRVSDIELDGGLFRDAMIVQALFQPRRR